MESLSRGFVADFGYHEYRKYLTLLHEIGGAQGSAHSEEFEKQVPRLAIAYFVQSLDWANLTFMRPFMMELAANWTRIHGQIRQRPELSAIVGRKEGLQLSFAAWMVYLANFSCYGNIACEAAIQQEQLAWRDLLPLTGRWIDAPLSISAIVWCSVCLLATGLILFVSLIFWKVLYSSPVYVAVAGLFCLSLALRIAFWTIALQGFGPFNAHAETTFYLGKGARGAPLNPLLLGFGWGLEGFDCVVNSHAVFLGKYFTPSGDLFVCPTGLEGRALSVLTKKVFSGQVGQYCLCRHRGSLFIRVANSRALGHLFVDPFAPRRYGDLVACRRCAHYLVHHHLY
jgi:hypothetical protein